MIIISASLRADIKIDRRRRPDYNQFGDKRRSRNKTPSAEAWILDLTKEFDARVGKVKIF